ncbi:MAG: hypothetical protein GX934_11740 [Burkholderiales bacterium]|jgi:hypothetical protein|nr:hypothetical protein [Burkholderiales bacterium]
MMTNDDLSDRPEAGLRSVETQGGDERISIHEVIAEVIADAYRAGQEAMRERCLQACEDIILFSRSAEGIHLAADMRCMRSHLLQAIRALEVE